MSRTAAAFLGVLGFVCAPLFAQNEQVSLTGGYSDTVSVGYVMIPFTALGSHGLPITDLRRSEFKLLVDGNPVRSDMFEKSLEEPVSFTILLDASGSMALAGKMDAALAAVGALIAHRRRGDDFSLYVFDDSGEHELVPFTEDPGKITAALANIHPYGKTAFFDALAKMPERSKLGRNPSRAIILLSDGIDNTSKLARSDLERMLEGIAVPIYSLGIRNAAEGEKLDPKHPNDALSDIELLEQIATLTGGRMFLGERPNELAQAVATLETHLRAQYLIGFTPTGQGAVKYRRISLKLAGGRIRSVRVRAGYMGTEPPRSR